MLHVKRSDHLYRLIFSDGNKKHGMPFNAMIFARLKLIFEFYSQSVLICHFLENESSRKSN
jgi:hypothetical protein